MEDHSELVAREGWIFIVVLAITAAVLFWRAAYGYGMVALALAVFCGFFFRNPRRAIDQGPGVVVSPADGRIMDITTASEDHYLHGSAVRIRIFLSIFNVHINRCPLAGRVEWVEKVPGLYLAAYKDEVSRVNARNYLGINTSWGKILVVQITGLIARRLVCWVVPGDRLTTGQRFGLIRFGSCTEVYLPQEAAVLVEAGQKVKGGESVIARFRQ
jgi:phosphatidylserine decarboxylase